jgi:hypothetical protein
MVRHRRNRAQNSLSSGQLSANRASGKPRAVQNLKRLAAAHRVLNARLRVHGLTDDEAAALPTQLDAETLGRIEISTWRTDAGDLDVLTDLPSREPSDLRFCGVSTDR